MAKLSLRKSILVATAAAMAVGAAAPASAGGRYHGGHYAYGGGHHYGKHHYAKHRGGYYYGSRHYRHRHGGHLSGGEAALLALGIVGGVVLIDRALERDRYASDPYYSAPPPRDYYRRDDRAPQIYRDDGYDGRYDDSYSDDGELLGGEDYGYSEQRYNYGAAYNDCKAETRQAATDAGVIVSLPAKPDRIIEIDDGAAVRFTANYVASDRGGEYRRTMVCEADEGGVRFLELV